TAARRDQTPFPALCELLSHRPGPKIVPRRLEQQQGRDARPAPSPLGSVGWVSESRSVVRSIEPPSPHPQLEASEVDDLLAHLMTVVNEEATSIHPGSNDRP